jgi:hypothetical protein
MTMANLLDNKPARFCWLDLAASNVGKAAEFYARMFDWQPVRRQANGGEFLQLQKDGEAFATLYQLNARQIAAGVPSHWTPYVAVADIDAMASRAISLGCEIAVQPFNVDGMARISLVVDSTGALLGLWELRK